MIKTKATDCLHSYKFIDLSLEVQMIFMRIENWIMKKIAFSLLLSAVLSASFAQQKHMACQA